ncbi:MAG: methyl-accepting chemotaxis protein [Pseudomonadales bacterium]|nr:methyl-accepting chemotaxis protein [Pseudomonadales bacterium]
MSKKMGVVGSLRSNPTLAALAVLLLLSLAVLVASAVRIQQINSGIQNFQKDMDTMRSANARMVEAMRIAMAGTELSFEEVNENFQDMEQLWSDLDGATHKAVMNSMPEQAASARDAWSRLKLDTESVYKNKDTLLQVHDVAERLKQTIPQIQEQYEGIVGKMVLVGATAQQIADASEQSLRAERLARSVDTLVSGTDDAEAAAVQFGEDAAAFSKALDTEKATMPVVAQSLNEVTALFKVVADSASSIAQAKQVYLESSQASSRAMMGDTSALLQEISNLSQGAANLPEGKRWNKVFIMTSLVVLVVLALMAVILLRAGSGRLHVQEAENERNQTAILRLLDELADLADGDLTTTATVSEDFTGAIADSINFTIDQLRVLVSRINDTAVRVSSAAQETQGTALHLAEASDHQAQEIAGASAAVNEMAVTIDQVSANAAESAAVAERSVSIANKGAEVVQNTIQGMDNIRDQIQETSKRIKRLGESSQEIGDIVSLINDIADQTNILALNAAIQASMAGDAGRGFAVVADEVQRLAERSSAATKQIEALVKTIQTDTNEAVASMEQTTAEVVRGARLAQDAGVALEEIENVSTTLAELIQNISNAARQQASSAGHISNTMNVIQEITSQTSAGTNATARAIGHLAEMAVDLRDSVQGFKLPDEVGGASGYALAMNIEDEKLSFA